MKKLNPLNALSGIRRSIKNIDKVGCNVQFRYFRVINVEMFPNECLCLFVFQFASNF